MITIVYPAGRSVVLHPASSEAGAGTSRAAPSDRANCRDRQCVCAASDQGSSHVVSLPLTRSTMTS